jgi:hypothetical protein
MNFPQQNLARWLVGGLGLVSLVVVAAEPAVPELEAGIQSLRAAKSYRWRLSTVVDGSNFSVPSIEGTLTDAGAVARANNADGPDVTIVIAHGQAAVQIGDSWKTAPQLPPPGDGRGNRELGLARQLLRTRTGADEAALWLSKACNLKKTNNLWLGALDEAAVLELNPARRPDRPLPPMTHAQGVVSFRLDGNTLAQAELHTEADTTFGSETRHLVRHVSLTFSSLGKAKAELPSAAIAAIKATTPTTPEDPKLAPSR